MTLSSREAEWSPPIMLMREALGGEGFWRSTVELDPVELHRLASAQPLPPTETILAFLRKSITGEYEAARWEQLPEENVGYLLLNGEAKAPVAVLRYKADESPKTFVQVRLDIPTTEVEHRDAIDDATASFAASLRYASEIHTISSEGQARIVHNAVRRLWSTLYAKTVSADLDRLRNRVGWRSYGIEMRRYREDAFHGHYRG